jgi:hypothetical protein
LKTDGSWATWGQEATASTQRRVVRDHGLHASACTIFFGRVRRMGTGLALHAGRRVAIEHVGPAWRACSARGSLACRRAARRVPSTTWGRPGVHAARAAKARLPAGVGPCAARRV